jgi:hypothetical protein
MAAAKSPAYQRSFMRAQNHSASYFARAVVLPDIVRVLGHVEFNRRGRPRLPKMLAWQTQQLGRLMSRASQMSRRVVELEQYVQARIDKGTDELTGQRLAVPLVLAMQPDELQRWMYCQEASTRAELAAAKLRKELREELEHIRRADGSEDLVGQMARLNQAEPVESEPSESED